MNQFEVGDLIEADLDGRRVRGRIETVGKYGYWIPTTHSSHGSRRVDFDKAQLIEEKANDDKTT